MPPTEAACEVGCATLAEFLVCVHNPTQYLTSPHEDVLDRARQEPEVQADALAAREASLFRQSSPWTSIPDHREWALR